MQATDRQPQRAPDAASVHHDRHRPEQTRSYRLVQQQAASFITHTQASTVSKLMRLIEDEFDGDAPGRNATVQRTRGDPRYQALPPRAGT